MFIMLQRRLAFVLDCTRQSSVPKFVDIPPSFPALSQ